MKKHILGATKTPGAQQRPIVGTFSGNIVTTGHAANRSTMGARKTQGINGTGSRLDVSVVASRFPGRRGKLSLTFATPASQSLPFIEISPYRHSFARRNSKTMRGITRPANVLHKVLSQSLGALSNSQCLLRRTKGLKHRKCDQGFCATHRTNVKKGAVTVPPMAFLAGSPGIKSPPKTLPCHKEKQKQGSDGNNCLKTRHAAEPWLQFKGARNHGIAPCLCRPNSLYSNT